MGLGFRVWVWGTIPLGGAGLSTRRHGIIYKYIDTHTRISKGPSSNRMRVLGFSWGVHNIALAKYSSFAPLNPLGIQIDA